MAAQLGIHLCIGAFWAFQEAYDFRFVFGKAFGMRMPGVAPMAEKAFAISRNAPEQASVFQLGVFLMVNAINEHEVKV